MGCSMRALRLVRRAGLALGLSACATPPSMMPKATGQAQVPPIGLSTPVACTFRDSDRWLELKLGFALDAPYVRIRKQLVRTEVDLPSSSQPEAVRVRVQARGVRLAGIAPARDFPLGPARAFVIDGIFVPGPMARFHLRTASASRAEVALEVQGVRGVQSPLRFARPCEDFKLWGSDFDPLDALGGRGIGEEAKLRAGKRIPLATQPSVAPVAELLPDEVHAGVDVLARDGDRSRIAWPVEQV